jgi:hypothetical protein
MFRSCWENGEEIPEGKRQFLANLSSDAAKTGKLCVDNERLTAARTAVMVEKKLIGFEVGAHETSGIVRAALSRPCGKLAQGPAMRVDRALRISAGTELDEKSIRKGGDSSMDRGLHGACTAFSATAHGR